MKLQIVTRYFLPVKAGIETHCYEIGKRLQKKGTEVQVYTRNMTFNKDETLPETELIEGMKVKRFHSDLAMVSDLDFSQPIYLNNFEIGLTFLIFSKAILVKLRGQRPFIMLVPHGGSVSTLDEYPLHSRIMKGVYNRSIGPFLTNSVATKVIAVSDWEKEMLIKEGIEKDLIAVLPNGMDDNAFISMDGGQRTVPIVHQRCLITLARISPVKNLDGMIRAIGQIEDLQLVICGGIQDEAYFRELQDLVRRAGLEQRVKFVGFVEGERKYDLLDRATAYIQLSWFEIDSISTKEAMARGKPIIVSDRGALPYLVKNEINGYVADPKNDESVVECIRRAISLEGEALMAMNEANIKDSEKYKWSAVAESLEELMREKFDR